VIRSTIPIPAFTVSVKSLPAYIPPTMPVGRIEIEHSLPDNLINTNTLTYWKLTLKGDGLPAQWLPAVLRQIQSNDEIRYSPVTSERSNAAGVNGMLSTVTHTIPLKALTNGVLDLPDIHAQYFDPVDGRLKTLATKEHSLYALSYIWRAVLLLLLGSLLYKGTRQLIIVIQRKRLQRKRFKTALEQISQAETAYEIRTALNQIALAENWLVNLSLTAWYQMWKSKYGQNDELIEVLNKLSLSCYSNEKTEPVSSYQAQFISCMTNVRK